MIAAGSHAGFVLTAYILAAAVLVGLFMWIVIDGRMQRRRLLDLEARGIRRRASGGQS